MLIPSNFLHFLTPLGPSLLFCLNKIFFEFLGVFFNNCHYICHRLVTIQADVFQNSVLISNNQCNFVEYFTELRNMAANTLEQHLIQVRRQLSTTFGSGDSKKNFF